MPAYDWIAFDADDTLWHTEYMYAEAQTQFAQMLAAYLPAEEVKARLYDTEMRNLQQFGYGIKGFVLNMIETAIQLTDERITAYDIHQLISIAKTMLNTDVQLLDCVADTLQQLAKTYKLMVITKGDLYDQEGKIARSGLADHFSHVEIVSNKQPSTYQLVMRKYAIQPARFLMVGNSLRSDILPVLAVGGHAVYIPHQFTWTHELADAPIGQQGYFTLEHIGQLPTLLARFD